MQSVLVDGLSGPLRSANHLRFATSAATWPDLRGSDGPIDPGGLAAVADRENHETNLSMRARPRRRPTHHDGQASAKTARPGQPVTTGNLY